MENCLVTKLKGVVDNDNLTKFGILKVPIDPYSGNSFVFGIVTQNPGDSKITVYDSNGNVVLVRDSGTEDHPNFIYPNIGATGGYYEVTNKYAIIGGLSSNVPFDNREKLPNVTELRYCRNLLYFSSGFCKGKVLDVAKIDSLTSMRITYLTGDIMDYVRERVNRGFTTGQIICSIYSTPNNPGCTVKFNGNELYSNNYEQSSDPQPKLKWEGTTKVYLLSDLQQTARVYGYTEEEIATMRQSGGEMENVVNVIRVD